MSKALVLIPARLAATRLPRKPLLDIAGKPMIVHVWQRAIEANIGPVVVAADSQEIIDVIESVGGEAVLTREDHPSGSDRIYEALLHFDASQNYDYIINVQGDIPTIAPHVIAQSVQLLIDNPSVAIATLAAEIIHEEERTNPNVVKLVGSEIHPGHLRALYFTRATAPFGDGPLYHHIGLYAYQRKALERFIHLPPSTLEKRERLEQLRALEAGMRIDALIVDDVPLGVDTPEDLEKACLLLKANSKNNPGFF